MSHSAFVKRRSLRQSIITNWRDFRVLMRAFSRPLFLFIGTLIVFGLLYRELSRLSGLTVPSPLQAIFLMLQMIFLQANMPFPDVWYLQLFFFIMPIVGIALLSAGVANLGAKLFNKAERGQDWEVALASTFSDHVIVCGVGKLGYRVIQQLLNFGQSIVAIEQDSTKPFISLVRDLDVPVILGDARLRDALTKAHIERASAIVCCTENDLTNLDIALDAREMQPGIKVVLRMFDDELAKKIERGFGIHTAFSTSGLAAPAFAAAATRAHIEYSFYVDNTLLHVSQIVVGKDSSLAGRQIEQVEREYDLTIVMHQTATETRMHPTSDDVIQTGDKLVVFASLETLGRLGITDRNETSGAKIQQPNQNVLQRLLGRRK
jgi:Trk K+ transport system NAD-binding subunit